MKLKLAQSDYYGGQINFVRRIAYRYGNTYTGDQGVTFLPTLQKIASSQFQSGVRTRFPTPKLKGYGSTTLPLRTLISIKYSGRRSKLTRMDWMQEDAKKVRRKLDILGDNWKEIREQSQGMNCQGHGILVLGAGIPKFRYRSVNLNLTVLLIRARVLTQVVTHTRCEPRL